MLLEADLKRGGAFQKVVQFLGAMIGSDEIQLECAENEIRTSIMLDRRDTFIDIVMDPKQLFASYRCGGRSYLMVDSASLSRVLEHQEKQDDCGEARLMARSGSSVGVLSQRGPTRQADRLRLLWEGKGGVNVSDLDLKVGEIEDRMTVPVNLWESKVFMKASRLRACVEHLAMFGTTLAITANSDGLFFSAGGDSASCTMHFRPRHEDVYTTIAVPVLQAAVPLRYVLAFSEAETFAHTAHISLSDAVVEFDYPIDNGSKTSEASGKVKCSFETDGGGACPVMLPMAQRSAENVFEASLGGGKKLLELFEILDEMKCADVDIDCLGDEIRIQGLDLCHVFLLDVCLSSKSFDFFRCEHSLSFSTSLALVTKYMSNVGEDDRLTLSAKDNSILRLMLESCSEGEAMAVEMDMSEQESLPCQPPGVTFKCEISFPSSMFDRVVRDLKGDNCTIGVTNEGVLFSDDNGAFSILSSKDEVFFQVKEPVKVTVALRYLKSFGQLSRLGSTVSISLDTAAMPVVLGCDTSGLIKDGSVKYFLAPKVSDEDKVDMTSNEVDKLSSRIRDAKEVIPLPKKRLRKKRKKQSPTSKTTATRKKPKPRMCPKKCYGCKEVKEYGEFFQAQLRKGNGFWYCVDCCVDHCKQAMVAYNESQSWEDIERSVVVLNRASIRSLRALGCERYECPKFFPEKERNLSDNLLASFRRPLPEHVTLMGKYDLVYYYSESGSSDERTYKQRSIRGELELTSNIQWDPDDKELIGEVDISIAHITTGDPELLFDGCFVFVEKVDSSCHDFEIPIEVVSARRFREERDAGRYTGSIRMLSKRTATPWNPKENPVEEPWQSESWEKRPVQFDTVEEAETLATKREEVFLASSWIYNHLSLPPELALRIHQFVAFRPPPAFFFEKGDLWIEVTWRRTAGQPATKTILVARRCD